MSNKSESQFKDISLNMFGKAVGDYLHSEADIVLASHPVKDIPTVFEIDEDKSSNKQIRANIRFIFDCGLIWGLAIWSLRDEEYKELDTAEAQALAHANVKVFLKEALKYVSKHDYELPAIYNDHNTYINFEHDARKEGEQSPFNKGVNFLEAFIVHTYDAKFSE